MAIAQLDYKLTCMSPQGLSFNRALNQRWAPGVGVQPVVQIISLTGSAFTALTPPAGAVFCCLALGNAVSLTLKGVTGDTGLALTPATNPLGLDAMFPLGASPSIGIANGNTSAQPIAVIWF